MTSTNDMPGGCVKAAKHVAVLVDEAVRLSTGSESTIDFVNFVVDGERGAIAEAVAESSGARQALAVLWGIEWCPERADYGFEFCPRCGNEKDEKHKSDCALAAAIRALEGK